MGQDLGMGAHNSQLAGRKLLILGAGVYQVPGIKVAKAMGLKVIALDGDPKAPGLALADISRAVDILNVDACLKVAEEFGVSGVMSICSESAVKAVAAVGEALGLPTISRDSAHYATDKYLMRKKFSEAGIVGPVFRQASTWEEALKAAKDIGYPLVTKPVDNAGSRGVRRVDSQTELSNACDAAFAQSHQHQIILEEFMDGQEVSVEAFTVNGKTTVLTVGERVLISSVECLTASRITYPIRISPVVRNEITQTVQIALKSLGINSGPSHVEVMITNSGVKVVDLAARGGGSHIFSNVIPLVCGISIIEESIKLALGLKPSLKQQFKRAATIQFLEPRDYGEISAVHGAIEARNMEGVDDVIIRVGPGEQIGAITWDGNRPGYIVAGGKTRSIALRNADTAARQIKFEVVQS